MAKAQRKAQKKLNTRIEDFDKQDEMTKSSRKRPGSLNRHKQVSFQQKKKR